MPDQEKIIEKHYIEVNPSPIKKFINGLLGGIGWGIGISLGAGVIIYLIGVIISKIDFIPILGQFLADIIKSAQGDLR